MPPEHDPDSFIKANGAAAFTEYKLKQQEDFILFKTSYLLKDVAHDPVKKSEAIKDIIHSISLVPDTIKRSLYVTECSGLLNMDERILVTEINKQRKKKFSKEPEIAGTGDTLQPLIEQGEPEAEVQTQSRPEKFGLARQEVEVVRLLLDYGKEDYPDEEGMSVAAVVLREMEAGPDLHFETPAADRILHEFWDAVTLGREIPDTKYFTDLQDQEVSKLAIDLSSSSYDLISENWVKMHNVMTTPRHIIMKRDIISTTGRYRLIQLKLMRADLQTQVKEAANDDTKIIELLTKVMRIEKAIQMQAELLGTVIEGK